jgi:hypothetical protein
VRLWKLAVQMSCNAKPQRPRPGLHGDLRRQGPAAHRRRTRVRRPAACSDARRPVRDCSPRIDQTQVDELIQKANQAFASADPAGPGRSGAQTAAAGITDARTPARRSMCGWQPWPISSPPSRSSLGGDTPTLGCRGVELLGPRPVDDRRIIIPAAEACDPTTIRYAADNALCTVMVNRLLGRMVVRW